MPKKRCGNATIDIKRPLSHFSLPRCKVTQIGTVFDEAMTFEEWAEIGKQAIRAAEGVQWLLGDWFNFGYRHFVAALEGASAGNLNRQKYSVAIEALPYQYQTLRNIAWVADSIILSRRRDKLRFTHHAEVAGLPEKLQERYLDAAVKDGLSCADLRALIRSEMADAKETRVASIDQSYTRFLTPAMMLFNQEPPERLSQDERQRRKRDLQPIVDYYQRL